MRSLSVVIPVYNEPEQAAETARSALTAVGQSETFDPVEVVFADDGSTVDVEAPVRLAAEEDDRLRFVRLPENAGRFAARRAGLTAAEGEYVLFIDAGVEITPGSLAFLNERVEQGADVWNAHTIMETGSNPFALFWRTVSSIAFRDYVDDPRETSFDASNFDRFPKGTTCFLAPRELLTDAFAAFRTRYSDTRNANDDGPIIRYIAERRPIHIAPGFACVYRPRRTFKSFARHAYHRGIVFVDGHGRRESRFFPVVVAFFPVSAALVCATVKKPVVAPAALLLLGVVAAAVAGQRRRPLAEVASFGALAPVYAVAHGLGMWRGALLAATARLKSAS
jgi:glycosyltransferase involved in cell wall biosynthesis